MICGEFLSVVLPPLKGLKATSITNVLIYNYVINYYFVTQ
jgi:hypothetical protein